MDILTVIGWVLIILAMAFSILIVSHSIIRDVSEEKRKTSILGIKELDHYMDKLCEAIKDLANDLRESFKDAPVGPKKPIEIKEVRKTKVKPIEEEDWSTDKL